MTAAVKEGIAARVGGEVLNFPAEAPVEKLMPSVRPLVIDAIAKLEEYGVPLFEEVAAARGSRVGHG